MPPIEIMTASRGQLLKVPGIGPKSADAILQARRRGHITDISHLQQLHIRTPQQVAPYMLLDGHKLATQMNLF